MAKKTPKTEGAKEFGRMNELTAENAAPATTAPATTAPETTKPKKSDAVRQAIAKLPNASAAEIAAEASILAGVVIGVPTVYAVKSGSNGSTGKKKPTTAKPSIDAVASIVAARSLIDAAGGADAAKRIIDAMA